MLKLVILFKKEAERALEAGVYLNDILNLEVRDKVARAKYIEEKDSSVLSIRIASDSFLLPPFKSAFYACSEKGFLIICDKKNCGIKSGDLLQIKLNKKFESLPLDSKSGAKIIVIG